MTDFHSSDYPNGHLLADVDWLTDNLTAEGVVILDARARGYEAGHIPGAVRIDVKELKNASGCTFAPAEAVCSLLESCGVSDSQTVVVYDEGGGVLAPRVFYVLEYFGLMDRVKLLNGGYRAWLAAGKEISTEVPTIRRGSLTLRADPKKAVTREAIEAGLDNAVLLDVRSAEEYLGKDIRSNRKGGHVPGARHLEWKEALALPDERGVVRFKEALALRRQFEACGVHADKTVVPYCQSNQRGAHSYFVLRLLGYADIRPYEGSWDEWGNAEHTPVEV